MRILRIHNRYQERGGEDVAFEAEVALLASRGEDVRTLVVSNDAIPDQRSPLAAARLALSTVWSRDGQQRVAEALETHQPDVAHFDNTFPLLSPAVYATCRSRGVAIVQTLHNYRLLCPNALFFRDGHPCEDCLGKALPLPGVVHGCYRDSRVQTAAVAAMLGAHRLRGTWRTEVDRYIALTPFARQKFIEGGLPADRIALKPHFLDPDPNPDPNPERHGRRPAGEAMVVVGRLAPYKGIPRLIDAWDRLDAAVPLRVIGDGPLAAEVEAWAARDPRVAALGRLPKPDVLREMTAARAVLVPSVLYETFGLTIVEAFACGTPVIASRLGAMADLVEHGRTGLLVEPGNAEDLAAAVRWAAAHPREMEVMGRAARRVYEERYTASRNYELLMGIYRDAIAVAHRHPAPSGHILGETAS